MEDHVLSTLSMFRSTLTQCRKGAICYEAECDIACMDWCDAFSINPAQLRVAISLVDDLYKAREGD